MIGVENRVFLDDKSKFIISELQKNGRVTYTELAGKLKITPAAVKERVERLIEKKIIRMSALINVEKFYPVTAGIGIEADSEGLNVIARKMKNCPLVAQMIKTSGMHNLVMSMVAEDVMHLEKTLSNHIRSVPGVRHIEVNIGNTPIIPDYRQLKLFYEKPLEVAPCGAKCDECVSYLDGSCKGCPVTVFYKGK